MGSSTSAKQALGWMEWLKGWFYVVHEILSQRIMASHLQNPQPLSTLNHLTCIITGSTSGIGLQLAKQLAESGAHVVMAVRNPKAANELIQKWQNAWSGLGASLNIEVHVNISNICKQIVQFGLFLSRVLFLNYAGDLVMEVDLLSLNSVVQFAKAWNARSAPLHVLINNAGIFSIGEPQRFSKDGYEEHMHVNHLAPALLSILLLPSLIRGSPSRIVNLNSIMHYIGFVDPEDMNVVSGKRKYSSSVGYSGSKLAQIMFNSIFQKRLPAEAGISVVCTLPGTVHTNVTRDLPKIVQAAYHLVPYFFFTAQEGSRSALFAATDHQVPQYCGLLKTDEWPVCALISHDCRPINASEEAHNVETSQKVWEKTLEMIGLPLNALDILLEGKDVNCRYGLNDGK